MTVDGSYMEWVRPTRRVHIALSVGMTVTGVILVAAGSFGGHGTARTAPALGRAADGVVSWSGVVSGNGGVTGEGSLFNGFIGGPLPSAPLVHFAPLVPVGKPGGKPVGKPSVDVHAHPKGRPHVRHAAPAPAPAPAPQLPPPVGPALAPLAPAPAPTSPQAHHALHPLDLSRLLRPLLHPSSPQLPVHPVKH